MAADYDEREHPGAARRRGSRTRRARGAVVSRLSVI
jgi:hypothetical protein